MGIFRTLDRHVPMDPIIRGYLGIIIKAAINLIGLIDRVGPLTKQEIRVVEHYSGYIRYYKNEMIKELT